jgi:putative addiction module killer protein
MAPSKVVTVQEYLDESGSSPVGKWLDSLDATAAAKVITALARIEQGNFSNVKGVGGGVFESKIHFGPGYRVYFGKDGEALVILVAGGTKKRQSQDVATAQERWKDYKQRKARES